MSRAAKIALVVLVAALVIATIALLVLRFPRGEGMPEATNGNVPPGGLPRAPTANVPPPTANVPAAGAGPAPAVQASAEERARTEILRTSGQFAERFGSYSSESNFENIEDLRPLMTESMKAWADRYIAGARATTPSGFVGVTTRAVAAKITDFSDSTGTAVAVISTQRAEAAGDSPEQRVYYQDVRITMRRVGGVWLVDAAEWQPV